MAFDDRSSTRPPGAAHLHTFFGNTGTNARAPSSRSATPAARPAWEERSIARAYWVPSMIDTADRQADRSRFAVFYYKQGYTLASFERDPADAAGLRMIAGDPTSAEPGSPAPLQVHRRAQQLERPVRVRDPELRCRRADLPGDRSSRSAGTAETSTRPTTRAT
jgi:hypothetical protein